MKRMHAYPHWSVYFEALRFLYPAEMSFHTNALLFIAALRQVIGRRHGTSFNQSIADVL